jgi:signal transduction histidine kinase
VTGPRAGDVAGRPPLEPLVRRAFWTAIVGVAAVAALAGALALVHRGAERWVHHSREVSRVARQALTLGVDRETALRGYLLTRDDSLLAPERIARGLLPLKLDTLVRLTADNPAQQARARAIAAALREWEGRFAAPALIGGAVPERAGKAHFDRVRARTAEFLDVEDALYRTRRRRAGLVESLLLVTIVGGLGLVGLMLHRLRGGLVAQAHSLDHQQHVLEEQAIELEVQTTELDATNDELRDTNERLLGALAETSRVNEELEALSYTMAHDLRAPLRALDGYGYMLEEDYGASLDERGREHLAKLRAASGRMARLIDDLLALARVGRGELRRERVDLSRMARAALDDLRRADPGRRVDARVTDGLVADGDPTLLGLVVQNLLGNAWKFSAQNAVAHLEVGIARRGAESAYFVRDDGAGFDPTYAEQIFGAFRRLHGAEVEGTGIGLAIVHRIVARHGGRVWAESSPGRGATFYFTIPQPGTTGR